MRRGSCVAMSIKVIVEVVNEDVMIFGKMASAPGDKARRVLMSTVFSNDAPCT